MIKTDFANNLLKARKFKPRKPTVQKQPAVTEKKPMAKKGLLYQSPGEI